MMRCKPSFAVGTILSALAAVSAVDSASAQRPSASAELEVSDDGAVLVRTPAPNQEAADGNPRRNGPQPGQSLPGATSRSSYVNSGFSANPAPTTPLFDLDLNRASRPSQNPSGATSRPPIRDMGSRGMRSMGGRGMGRR